MVICSPPIYHAEQAISALEEDIHVLSEVPAAYTLEECKELVKAARESKGKYMMAENYCFFAFIQTWKAIIRAGLLGRITYAEAEYIHDIRELLRWHFRRDGPSHWRLNYPFIQYCTHALGPILYLLEGDYCVSVSALDTGPSVLKEEMGRELPDAAMALFKTAKGVVIKYLVDLVTKRISPPYTWYCVNGTKGYLESERSRWDKPKANLEDIPNLHDYMILPIDRYYPRDEAVAVYEGYESSSLKEKAIGWGGEWRMLNSFLEALRRDTKPPIDVYEAMDYTVPGIIARESAERGGVRLEIPNLRRL